LTAEKTVEHTGQQATHSTLIVGLHKACNYCQTFAIKSIRYTLQISEN